MKKNLARLTRRRADNATVFSGTHAESGRLATEKHALRVHRHDLVPIVLGEIFDFGDRDHAGILDGNVEQVTVSRLLRRAEQLNIVRTTVVSPAGVFGHLEDLLEKKYGLQQAIVAEASINTEEAIMRAIGSSAAYFVETTLKSNEIVGLSSWSISLLSMVDQMHPVRRIEGCTIVQIQGGLGNPSAEKHAHHLVTRFARMIDAQVRFLPAPCIVGSSDAGNILLRDPSIRQTMELFGRLTLALVGIGATEPSDLLASSGNVYSDEDTGMLQTAGAVGDIAARFFDAQGVPVVEPLDGRVIGITLEELRNVPRSVGIAGGKRKLNAIRGALFGRHINILVTDQYTAEGLVKLFDNADG